MVDAIDSCCKSGVFRCDQYDVTREELHALLVRMLLKAALAQAASQLAGSHVRHLLPLGSGHAGHAIPGVRMAFHDLGFGRQGGQQNDHCRIDRTRYSPHRLLQTVFRHF